MLYKAESDNRVFTYSDYKVADWTNIKAYLNSVDFFQLFHSNQPAAVIIDDFYHVINTLYRAVCSTKSISVSKKSRLVKYPYRIRRLLRKKATAWRIRRTFRTPESIASYKKLASECKSAIHSFTLHYENQLITNANIGSFTGTLIVNCAVNPLSARSATSTAHC
jgi:hypothetical protein